MKTKKETIALIILALLIILFLPSCLESNLYIPPYSAAEVERRRFEAEQGHPARIRIATVRF